VQTPRTGSSRIGSSGGTDLGKPSQPPLDDPVQLDDPVRVDSRSSDAPATPPEPDHREPDHPAVRPHANVRGVKANRIIRRLPQWVKLFVANPWSLAGCVLFLVIVLAALLAPLLTPYQPYDMIGPLGKAPSASHWLGTNDAGEDVFAQIVYGGRFSLGVGLAAGLAITITATLCGMTAGYSGGWVDDFLTMVMNVFLVVPQLPLLVVISAYVPLKGDHPVRAGALMAGVLLITGWAWGARVIRSQTLTLRRRDFVLAAKVGGETTWRIIFREILPNMTSLLVNTVILSTMGAILAEAALDYLGIGSTNQVTWGTMLNKAQADSTLFSGEWWVFLFPGLAIALTVMSMILMNNGIDAISNPRLRSYRRRRSRLAVLRQSIIDREAIIDRRKEARS
jgi:peptide/nickel transport system permease protein